MFGLEGNKKKKKADQFIFELENELQNARKYKELKEHIENRIQEIKQILREGENKKEFERFGLILNGYTALLKVFSRFNPK